MKKARKRVENKVVNVILLGQVNKKQILQTKMGRQARKVFFKLTHKRRAMDERLRRHSVLYRANTVVLLRQNDIRQANGKFCVGGLRSPCQGETHRGAFYFVAFVCPLFQLLLA